MDTCGRGADRIADKVIEAVARGNMQRHAGGPPPIPVLMLCQMLPGGVRRCLRNATAESRGYYRPLRPRDSTIAVTVDTCDRAWM